MKNLSPHLGHAQFRQSDLSRRRFLGFTAGAFAGVATSSLSAPAVAGAEDRPHRDGGAGSPRPIPGGVTLGPPIISAPPVFIHHLPFVKAAVPFREPSQITDFKGFVTNCRVTGRGTGTDAAGTHTRLAYQVDNGFMDGRFVGLDGRRHEGTFGFTWLDLFRVNQDGSRTQIHDFSFGIAPSGLFWTAPVPADGVEGELDDGFATFGVTDLSLPDGVNLDNALHGGPTVPATVSFDMRWSGIGSPFDFTNTDDKFRGKFQFATVAIEWSAHTEEGFSFVSDPADTTATVAAIIGEERNGVYF